MFVIQLYDCMLSLSFGELNFNVQRQQKKK